MCRSPGAVLHLTEGDLGAVLHIAEGQDMTESAWRLPEYDWKITRVCLKI